MEQNRAALEDLNRRGAGVFVAVNGTDGKGRKKSNIRTLRAWWCDVDSKGAQQALDLAALPLCPSMVVRTPGGWHLYWCADALMPCGDKERRAEHEAEVKAIAWALAPFGGDLQACDVARVLRVPGFLHRKAEPAPVILEWADGPRYTRDQIRAAFPVDRGQATTAPCAPEVPPLHQDREAVLRRAGAYLETMPGGIQGSNGSGATFEAALKVVTRFNLTEAEALVLMEEVHNPKCEPSWSRAELEHKVADAWQRAQGSTELGCALMEPARGPQGRGGEDTPQAPEGRPCVAGFEWGTRGLFLVKENGKDAEGQPLPPARTWIAPPFTLPGLVRDLESSGWRLLIAWDDLDGVHHEEAVPFDLLSGEGTDLARTLAQGGMMLSPDPGPRKALLRYLCGAAPKIRARVRLVETLGWHGGAFVLPDGSVVGKTAEAVRYSGAGSPVNAGTGGTLQGWQDQVAAYAVGEPRLAFALACAFAGPLLRMVRPDARGGFNIQGASSKGKSTVLEVAASVWGSVDTLPTWRATSNGLEGVAASRNDGFLPLDEMNQAKDDEIGDVAYMLANGSAKVRAKREGGTRPLHQWGLIFLSTGERGVDAILAGAGKRAMAGHEVRVPDIPCPTSGIFEGAHGFPGQGALAEHLKAQARAHYGHASRAFLEGLCAEWERRAFIQGKLLEMEAEWMEATIPQGADAQVRRVGGRFALVAVAGELAQRMGVLPWPEGESFRAAGECFRAWLDRRGHAGASETHKGIEAVLAFIEKHGTSRFDEWGVREARVINRAGTRKRAEGPVDGWDYFITSEGWREACQGSGARDVARACADAGILEPDGAGKLARSIKIPGHGAVRCYVIRACRVAQHQGGDE
nr:DUF927 domain-containing protein [Geothrix paludis]